MSETKPLEHYFLERLARYEAGLMGLIRDVREGVPGVTRREGQLAVAKLDLLIESVDRMIRTSSMPADEQSAKLREIHEASEELILLKARLERQRRALDRDEEDLEIQAQRAHVRQLRAELDAEVGAAGHGLGGEG